MRAWGFLVVMCHDEMVESSIVSMIVRDSLFSLPIARVNVDLCRNSCVVDASKYVKTTVDHTQWSAISLNLGVASNSPLHQLP